MFCEIKKTVVDKLISEYDSPLYVFHVDEFKQNYLNLLNSIREYYPKYNIAYSFKTNYTPKICQIVKEFGGLAEVVSDMEFNLARRIGFDYKDIIFNGPVKGESLFVQISNGAVANIDSLDELDTVIAYANEHSDKQFSIAFRVNIDIGQGFVSRFGIDAYEDEVLDSNSELHKAFDLVTRCENLKVIGLHCHVGRSRGLEAWRNRVRIMFALIDRYFTETPEFIDLGSGMNSVMEPELAKQFDGYIPEFSEYAEVVGKAMNEKYGNLSFDEQPVLYTEPGTTLISGCMSFLSTVETIKSVKGKTYITFNCSGGNMGDICHLKNLPIGIFHCGNALTAVSDATFVGYTCLEHDHIYENYTGEISVGDVVQFRNVGSYSNVFKPPFILPNCAMVQIDSDGNTVHIKRRETIEDIFQSYIFN